MTTWQSNDDVRRNGGAEVAEFMDEPATPVRSDEDDEGENGADEARGHGDESKSP